MIKKVIAALLLLVSSGVLADEDASIRLRSTVTGDSGTFLADVLHDEHDPGFRLVISCQEECKYPGKFEESTIDFPIYVMTPRDGSDRLVTLWTTGSAYRIKIYRVGPAKIEKLLEVGSKSAPDISIDEQGNEHIAIHVEQKVDVYVWKGSTYVLQSKK